MNTKLFSVFILSLIDSFYEHLLSLHQQWEILYSEDAGEIHQIQRRIRQGLFSLRGYSVVRRMILNDLIMMQSEGNKQRHTHPALEE